MNKKEISLGRRMGEHGGWASMEKKSHGDGGW
jgi:hypothetical protein